MKLWERITLHFANSRALLAFISQGQILSLLFTVINAETNRTPCSIHCEKALKYALIGTTVTKYLLSDCAPPPLLKNWYGGDGGGLSFSSVHTRMVYYYHCCC